MKNRLPFYTLCGLALMGCGNSDISASDASTLSDKLGKPMTQSGPPGAGAKTPVEPPNGGKPKNTTLGE